MKAKALTMLLFLVIPLVLYGCAPSGEGTKKADGNAATATSSSQPESVPRGTADPDIAVEVYDPDKAYNGTTFFADIHEPGNHRIIEVNMLGEVVWEYKVPPEWQRFSNPGFDVEHLADDNILFMLPRYGVVEVDRGGNVVWTYRDPKVTHDVDRLPNGNTLVVFGGDDTPDDAQVKEVNAQGEIVWSWRASDHFNGPEYEDVYREGWTHTNAAVRMDNGNTLICLRNFNILVEVNPDGSVVRTIGEGILFDPHDPEVQDDGNVLLADHTRPANWAIEIDPETGEVVWRFGGDQWEKQLVRDADRLPNGNTLLTGTSAIAEITGDGEVVWQLRLKDEGLAGPGLHGGDLYKAQRVGPND